MGNILQYSLNFFIQGLEYSIYPFSLYLVLANLMDSIVLWDILPPSMKFEGSLSIFISFNTFIQFFFRTISFDNNLIEF